MLKIAESPQEIKNTPYRLVLSDELTVPKSEDEGVFYVPVNANEGYFMYQYKTPCGIWQAQQMNIEE